MSPKDIIAYGQTLCEIHHPQHEIYNPKNVYYITPINEHETVLTNIDLEKYHLPTSKLSDIHAILHIRHPQNNYQIQYDRNYIPYDNILTMRSYPTHPNTLFIEHFSTDVRGNYNINIDRITPISCDNISLVQATAAGIQQMHAQFQFMQHAKPNTYHQTSITHGVRFPNHPDTHIQLHLYNAQHKTDIAVDIDIYRHKSIRHTEQFTFAPDKIHRIKPLVDNASNNILDHMSNNRDIYSAPNDSEHRCIELLRCVKDYCSRGTNGLTDQLQHHTQNMLNHYTYQP